MRNRERGKKDARGTRNRERGKRHRQERHKRQETDKI